MHATDADEMTPQQRLDAIAGILAEGFLRLKDGRVTSQGPNVEAPSRPRTLSHPRRN